MKVIHGKVDGSYVKYTLPDDQEMPEGIVEVSEQEYQAEVQSVKDKYQKTKEAANTEREDKASLVYSELVKAGVAEEAAGAIARLLQPSFSQ